MITTTSPDRRRRNGTGTIVNAAGSVTPATDRIRGNIRTRATISLADSWKDRTAKVGVIETPYDEDLFKIELVGGPRYHIEVRSWYDQRFYNVIVRTHTAN